jgi:uncharacterized protein YggE
MYVRTLVSISAVALWAVSPARLSAQDGGSVPEIITSGTGTVTLPPDRAVLRVEVMTADSSAAGATIANGPLVASVESALRAVGLPDDAIRPVGFSLSQRRDPTGQEPPSGYEARTALEVRVDDVNALGRILDAAIEAGATGVPSISFRSDSVAVARRTALATAVAAARDDAETLARASGGRLGALVMVTTSPQSYGLAANAMIPRDQITVTGRTGSISAIRQDVVVSLTVQTRWRLEP